MLSNFHLKLLFLRILINFLFSLQTLRKLREAVELKRYAAHQEQKGLQELELAMVGTPRSWLVDLMSAGVHKAGEPDPLSGAPSPSVEGWWAPSLLEQAPKRACYAPTTITSVAPKEEKVTLQEVPLPSGPSDVIAGPSGISTFQMALQRGPLVPCHIPQVALPARSFKQVNLKGYGKMYVCGQC